MVSFSDFESWLALKIRPRLVQLHCQSFYSSPQKACFEIWPLLLRTKGTIMIVGSKGTSWNLEMELSMAGDGGTTT